MKLKLLFSLLIIFNHCTLSVTYKLTHFPFTAGFFSAFHSVLGALDFYDTLQNDDGFIVDFEDQGLYYDPSRGPNWWNYYFEPIEIKANHNEVKKFPNYKKINFSFFGQFGLSRTRSHELIKKYIHLKPHIQKKLDTFLLENFFNNQIIGIHYRGTDKQEEAPQVSYEVLKLFIEREIKEQKNLKIFIATDDANFLSFMQKQFPGKIINSNATRSSDGKPPYRSPSRDPYQIGEDGIFDCLLLSKCSKVYRTASNLSDTAQKINPLIPVIQLNKSKWEEVEMYEYNTLALFNTTLSLLDKYEHKELTGFSITLPVISTEYPQNRCSNWWKTCFEPLSIGTNDQLEIPYYSSLVLGINNIFEMSANRAHELITKYITIQPTLLEKINTFINQECKNHYIIGVYYEHGWYSWIFNKLDEQIKKCPTPYKIVLITSDQYFFNEMKKRYSPVITMDINTSKDEAGIAQAILLSKLNEIIGSSSETIQIASQFNPTIPVHKVGKSWKEME